MSAITPEQLQQLQQSQIEQQRQRTEFMRLWQMIREKLPADWRRQPGAEQAAWLMFLEMKGAEK